MAVRKQRFLKNGPNFGILVPLTGQIVLNPTQKSQTGLGGIILSRSPPNRTRGIPVLPVSVPTLTRNEYRNFETNFGEKNLIFVNAPKTILESTESFDNFAPQQNV